MDPEDLRGAASLAELLTSLRRRRPPTEPLLRRKFDALSPSAVDALPFLVERAVPPRLTAQPLVARLLRAAVVLLGTVVLARGALRPSRSRSSRASAALFPPLHLL